MLLNYTKANVLNVPVLLKDKDSIAQVERTVVIRPGTNEISQEEWTQFKKYPRIASHLKNHVIIVLSEDDGDDTNIVLSKMDISKAVEAIKTTYNVDLLEKWRATEKRSSVADAISKQIKMIEEAAKKEEA